MNPNQRKIISYSLVGLMLALFLPSSIAMIDSGAVVAPAICTGGTAGGFPSITENNTNVTSSLSDVGSGVSVEEITSPSSGYSASFVYYDTPVYSAAMNKIIYYVFPAHGPDLIVAANVDGTNPQVIGQSYANPIITSDGKMVVFASQGTTPNTASMYAINLTQSGSCKTYKLGNFSFPQGQIAGGASYAPVYYYSEYDAAAGRDMIYIWQYNTIYRVFENGSALQPVTIPDPYGNVPATFHHLKPNPQFPNIIAYLWDQVNETIGTPETYIVNLNNPAVPYLVFNSTSQGHENWAPNGQQLGDASWPYWVVANVLDSSGNVITFDKTVLYNFTLSEPLYSDFSIQKVGPNIAASNSTAAVEYAPQYCAWGPDSNLLACSSISGNRTGSEYGNMPIYLLYLNGTSRFLLSTDSLLKSYWGEPALIFLNDSNHIIYRSDRDGSPQLYEITLTNILTQSVGTTQSSSSSPAQTQSSTSSYSTIQSSSSTAQIQTSTIYSATTSYPPLTTTSTQSSSSLTSQIAQNTIPSTTSSSISNYTINFVAIAVAAVALTTGFFLGRRSPRAVA